MIEQTEFSLPPFPRGFHLITDKVEQMLPQSLPEKGLLHLFIKHTSAGICISENCSPEVLADFETTFNRLVPEGEGYTHNEEGPDDMPAHVKSVLTAHQLTIPISNYRLNLGTWQGIYLCEFRNRAAARKLVLTVYS